MSRLCCSRFGGDGVVASFRVTKVRIVLNGAGIRELLRRQDTQDMLEDRAGSIAAAANGMYALIPVGRRLPDASDPWANNPEPVSANVEHITAEVRAPERTPTRARARVVADHPAALNVEGKHRVLGASVDAGRSGGGRR